MTDKTVRTYEVIRWAVLTVDEPLEVAMPSIRLGHATHEEAMASIAQCPDHVRDLLEIVKVTHRVVRLGVRP